MFIVHNEVHKSYIQVGKEVPPPPLKQGGPLYFVIAENFKDAEINYDPKQYRMQHHPVIQPMQPQSFSSE